MILHNQDSSKEGTKLMVQRPQTWKLKPLLDNEEAEREERMLLTTLNPAAPPLPLDPPPPFYALQPAPLPADGAAGTSGGTLPLQCAGTSEMVSPFKTYQGTQFGQDIHLGRAGQFPLRQYPARGLNAQGQPMGLLLTHALFSTSDLLNWKN
jgi:hypothetical protein